MDIYVLYWGVTNYGFCKLDAFPALLSMMSYQNQAELRSTYYIECLAHCPNADYVMII